MKAVCHINLNVQLKQINQTETNKTNEMIIIDDNNSSNNNNNNNNRPIL